MANYSSPYHPLTDRQQTAWVKVYDSVMSEAPEEIRLSFEYLENIIAMHVVDNIQVPRMRDTHIATARKYAKAWMATLLEQGWLQQLLVTNTANIGDFLADAGQTRNATASMEL